jgi:AcrR family transcriptional regulator
MRNGTGTDSSSGSRDAILEASARVVSRRGFAETRLVDIADEAGVSIGLLQHHFRTRDRLLSQTFEAHSAKLVAEITNLAHQQPQPDIRLRQLLRYVCGDGVLADLQEEWALWLEYWLASTRDAVLAEQCAGIYQEWQTAFREVLTAGADAGTFQPGRAIDDIVDELLAMLDGLMIRLLMQHPTMTPARVEQLLVSFVEDSLHVQLPMV